MVTKFVYITPLRQVGFYYAGPPWILLAVVVLLILVVLGLMP